MFPSLCTFTHQCEIWLILLIMSITRFSYHQWLQLSWSSLIGSFDIFSSVNISLKYSITMASVPFVWILSTKTIRYLVAVTFFFGYQCLMVDWCRIKLECPTCKRPFKMFKRSIRSWFNFRCIHVPVTSSSSAKLIEVFHHHHQSSSTEDELFQEYFQSTVDLILPPL